MKKIRIRKLRVDKRTKVKFGRYTHGGKKYFRVWTWGFYLE